MTPEEYRHGKYVWGPGDIEVDEDLDEDGAAPEPTLDQIRAVAEQEATGGEF